MKCKYKVTLFIISFLILANVLLLCHYGIYTLGSKNDYIAVSTSGCIGVIYSDEENIILKNPKNYSDEDGKSLIPKTITISNNCDNSENISLYLDLYDDSTIEDNKMKVNVNGDIELETTKLDEINKYVGEGNILNTYKLLNIKMDAFETKRINFRTWLDYDETVEKEKNIFHFKYYVLSDKESNKLNFSETVLNDNKISEDNGLIKLDDNYYFKGNVENNYVSFADTMWRIVSINSSGNVKLVYAGEELRSKFNDNNYLEKKVNYDESIIKDYLDKYYEDYLSKYDDLIEESKYCIDTSYDGAYVKKYGSYLRNIDNNSYSLDCKETELDYGGLKDYKIGLLTMDELAVAGLNSKEYNSNYLFDEKDFYTISPAAFNGRSFVGILTSDGLIDAGLVFDEREVRPVINLKSFVEVNGKGTLDNPYLIIN